MAIPAKVRSGPKASMCRKGGERAFAAAVAKVGLGHRSRLANDQPADRRGIARFLPTRRLPMHGMIREISAVPALRAQDSRSTGRRGSGMSYVTLWPWCAASSTAKEQYHEGPAYREDALSRASRQHSDPREA